MRCQGDLGQILRQVRLERGLSQARLALRAGTSQDAISRIERGEQSPSFERFRELLFLMGHRPALTIEPLDPGMPGDQLHASLDLTPEERLRESASWGLVATSLELAGEEARRSGHPATRRWEA